MPISVHGEAPSCRQVRQPRRQRGRQVAGSRGASKAEEVMAELWPAATAQGHGEENAGSSSGWTLAAAAPTIGASKKLKSIPPQLRHAFFRTCVWNDISGVGTSDTTCESI
jgi:hypothetical protein